jgi:hypothetical protein
VWVSVIPAQADVIPAKAGIQSAVGYLTVDWIPAFAGMTPAFAG